MAVTLRQLRERKKLSQRQLALLTGIQQTTISTLERGAVADPRTSTVQALARVLGQPPAVIIRAIRRAYTEAA